MRDLTIMPNIEISEGLNLVKMLEVVGMALIVKYGVSCFKNLKALFELTVVSIYFIFTSNSFNSSIIRLLFLSLKKS